MIRALWTVVAYHDTGKRTYLGICAVSYSAAEDIAKTWRAAYLCPCEPVRVT